MEIQDMTKEQLIEYIINFQNDQIRNLRKAQLSVEKTDTNLPVFYENFKLLSANTSSIGLIVTDSDGTIISFNKALQDMLGIFIEDYRNRNVSELYVDPDERRNLLEMLAESGTVRDFEVQVKHSDGSQRTVLANVDYIEMDNTHVLLTALYDISQYKQRQEIQKEYDKSYRTLFSDVPVGITVTDFQGDLVVSNNAIHELLGYTAEELKNIYVQDFYAMASDRQELLDLTEKLGNVRDFETVFRRKDGSTVPVLINTDKIEFKDRKDMLLTSMRDISSLKRVEDELTRERDLSNAILDTAASLIVVLDRKGRITRFNRACEQISGYSSDEVNGTYLRDAPFLDREIAEEEIDKLLKGHYPITFEALWGSENGDKRIISWTNTALLDSNGNVEYVIATGIDITERKKAAEKLQTANTELGARVEELQERTEEMDRLNEMGEQLQSCQTVEEACTISTQYIKEMCPASRGALYLIDKSKTVAEAAEMWGDPPFTQKGFAPLGCWAIRRGRMHLIDNTHPGLRCEHITGPQEGQYLCMPLLVNGEAVGILHLNYTSAPGQEQQMPKDTSFAGHKLQVIKTIAEHIGLALSNLRLKESLRQQSIRDALTGLFNRRYMEETLERELSRAKRENTSVGVLMFDIDHFKKFNDDAGHDAGDALLRELAAFLNKKARGGDIVCRYGGEEFLAVLPGISREDAALRAEELRKGIEELSVYHLGKTLPKCTISIGVAMYPENGPTITGLIKAADDALYKAKDGGRNMVVTA